MAGELVIGIYGYRAGWVAVIMADKHVLPYWARLSHRSPART